MQSFHSQSMRQLLILFIILINALFIQAQATKDGIYLKSYVVNTLYSKLTELKGKITTVKGTTHFNYGEAVQGWDKDTRPILKPKIRVLTN